MDTGKLANVPRLKIHLLITLARKELHACWFRGSGNQTSDKFPLASFHIILLLSASCSSLNVLGPSGPLSSMNDGFLLDKWPSIYHCGAPGAKTGASLFLSTSKHSDGPALDPPPPLSLGGSPRLLGVLGRRVKAEPLPLPEGRPSGLWRHHLHSPRWPVPAIIHPPLCRPSLSSNRVIHHPVEFWESNEIIMPRVFCKYRMGRAVKGTSFTVRKTWGQIRLATFKLGGLARTM